MISYFRRKQLKIDYKQYSINNRNRCNVDGKHNAYLVIKQGEYGGIYK